MNMSKLYTCSRNMATYALSREMTQYHLYNQNYVIMEKEYFYKKMIRRS